MLRFLNVMAIVALVGSAVYAYSIKYETIFYASRITKLKHEMQAERQAIGTLRAEWSHLTRPERVQALAEKHLDLQPLALNQIVKADALPERAAKVDTIGRKLDALGLSEPTNTPRENRGAGPATPAAR